MIEYTNSKMEWVINEFVHSERNRAVLSRLYLDRITQGRAANEFQMSRRQIQNIDYWFRRTVLPRCEDMLI